MRWWTQFGGTAVKEALEVAAWKGHEISYIGMIMVPYMKLHDLVNIKG
jgi:hypothetical protein